MSSEKAILFITEFIKKSLQLSDVNFEGLHFPKICKSHERDSKLQLRVVTFFCIIRRLRDFRRKHQIWSKTLKIWIVNFSSIGQFSKQGSQN